jgi:1-acyl-sn-glycerol-3-phosphate acyltransferase
MLSRIRIIWALIELGVTIAFTIVFMYIFRSKHRTVRRIWAKMQPYLLGYKIVQKGKLSKKANLLLLNHQSMLDIVVIEDLHPGDPCWVAKNEITKIPFYRHIMYPPQMIAIDRSDRRSMVKLVKSAKKRVENGRTIAIFPEGTRSDGKRLLKFQSGAKILAEKLGLIVQPAVIVGSREILDSKNFLAKWGEVRIVFLDPVDPKENPNWYEDVKLKMKETLENELANPPRNW